jgi:hypothetical protein
MKRCLFTIAISLGLAACQTAPIVPERFTAPPVPSQCNALCTASCVDDPWPQWTCDNPLDPVCWDVKDEQVTVPLRQRVETCDAHRQACVQCLGRLDDVGLTCGTKVPCTGGN